VKHASCQYVVRSSLVVPLALPQMPVPRKFSRAHVYSPAIVPCASADAACRAAQLRGLFFHTANASELAASRWLRSSSCKGRHDRCSAASATEIQAWQRAVEVPSRVHGLLLSQLGDSSSLCAVVIDSDQTQVQRLPTEKLGARIDRATFVIRIGRGTVRGREDDVGSRTTLRVVQEHGALKPPNELREKEAVIATYCSTELCWRSLARSVRHRALVLSPGSGTSGRHRAVHLADALCGRTVVYEADGRHATLPREMPAVRIVVVSLVPSKKRAAARAGVRAGAGPETRYQIREEFLNANRREVPGLHVLDAVNGYDRNETIRQMRALRIPYCFYCKRPSFGDLANALSKLKALQEQVERRVPFQAIVDDDVLMHGESFPQYVADLSRSYFLATDAAGARDPVGWRERRVVTDLVKLGNYGEGQLTSLVSAERILRKWQTTGFIGCSDQQWGSSWRMNATIANVAKYTPWTVLTKTNSGDVLKAPFLTEADEDMLRGQRAAECNPQYMTWRK